MERSTSTTIQSAKKKRYSSSINIPFSSIITLSHIQLHYTEVLPKHLHWGLEVMLPRPTMSEWPPEMNAISTEAPIGCWSHGQGGCFMPSFQGNLRLRSMLEPLIFGSLCDLPVRPGRFSSIPISSYVCACATYLHCARMWCDYCHICGPRATQSPICAARPPKSLPSNAAFPKQQKTSCYHRQWNRPHSFNYSNLWLSEVVVNHIT